MVTHMPLVSLVNEEDDAEKLSDILNVLSRKYSVKIIMVLGSRESMRFTQLRKHLNLHDTKSLIRALKSLKSANIIDRTVLPFSPPAVEYSLTETGKSIRKSLILMSEVTLH